METTEREITRPNQLSPLIESNRVISFNARDINDPNYISLEGAIAYSKTYFGESANLAKRITEVAGVKVSQTELSFYTTDETHRSMVCERFGLRRTSHISNREAVIYTIIYP